MQITTKFNIGDSVVFLHRNCFTRRVISRIEIEASKQQDEVTGTRDSTLIRYYFDNLVNDFHSNESAYKYENEIAATKEELAKEAREYNA